MSATSSQGGSIENEPELTDSGGTSVQDAVAADHADHASSSGRSEGDSADNSARTWSSSSDGGSGGSIAESGSDDSDSGSDSPPIDVRTVPPERMAAGVPPFVAYYAHADVNIGMSLAGDCECSIFEKESAHRSSYTLVGRTVGALQLRYLNGLLMYQPCTD
jgi:hypothetical protein